MLFLGHLGIGAKIARPWTHGLKLRWVLLGTVLPDLIDKPLYYALSWTTGKRAAELGLLSCTRTLGHTGALLIAITLISVLVRSRAGAALAIGVATHLLLDNVGDRILGHLPSSAYMALIFPLRGFEFGIQPTHDWREHFLSQLNLYSLVTELLGFLCLTWGYWKKEKRAEIKRFISSRRFGGYRTRRRG